ncbi:MAG: SpoIID/LytB domain-containing protein, partial [bacterium]|nr:SpoIID/LytB domain-containing protein [bacterium]
MLVSGDTVRILILDGVEQVELGATGDIVIFDAENNRVNFAPSNPIIIRVSGTGFSINGKKVNQPNLKIVGVEPLLASSRGQPLPENKLVPLLSVNERKYRGEFKLINPGNSIQVVNILDLEEYLCGVVPREMPYSWHPEALKAQAVAARTYTYNKLYNNNRKSKEYDLLATIADQVYGGYTDERESCNTAICATQGEILVYNDKPIYACYHGNSGGVLEDNADVFGSKIPYLRGKSDSFAAVGPANSWRQNVTADEIRTRLNKNGLAIGKIGNIKLTKVADTGRVREITIEHAKGKTRLTGVSFRHKMGTTFIRSTLFTLEKQEDNYLFSGKGSGHGVGMSQWSAKYMADHGKNY